MTAPPPPPATGTPPAGATPPNSPPPPGGPAPRRLTRRLEGRLLGGVAAGLAAYLGVDVVLVRIAFVVLAFVPFPGFAVLLYVAMLLLVPTSEDGSGAVTTDTFADRGAGFWIGLGLVALATWSLLGAWAGAWHGGRLLPLLLIGLGIALWVDADRRRSDRASATSTPSGTPAWGAPPSSPPPSSGPSTPAGTPAWSAAAGAATATTPGGPALPTGSEPAAPAWTAPSGPSWADPAGPPAPPVVPPTGPAPAWEPPPVQRPRSPLGRITLGVALLAGGAAWLLDVTGVVAVPATTGLAIVLGVTGVGLLVGSVLGRARWLALLVAVLLPLTFAAAAVEELGIDVRGGVDSRTVVVDDLDELARGYRIGAGDLTIDLTGLDDPGDVRLDASVGAGELVVVVPEGAGVVGDARAEVGEVRLFGGTSGGISVDRGIDVPADPGQPTFELQLRVGAGTVEVRTGPSTVAEAVPDHRGC